MTFTRRLLVISAVALSLSLAGCAAPPKPTTNTDTGSGSTAVDLSGSKWSGTDSDGDTWAFEFQSDGTVGLTYDGSSYDDAGDTWKTSGSTLTLHIGFDDGNTTLTGPYSAKPTIDLDGTVDGKDHPFTLTITKG